MRVPTPYVRNCQQKRARAIYAALRTTPRRPLLTSAERAAIMLVLIAIAAILGLRAWFPIAA